MATPQNSCAYFGDRPDWWIVHSVHRDSDSLERSNHAVMLERLSEAYPDHVEVERFSHCLVGWMDHMIVSGFGALRMAARMAQDIERYPILDETHYSELEDSDFWSWAESELSVLKARE